MTPEVADLILCPVASLIAGLVYTAKEVGLWGWMRAFQVLWMIFLTALLIRAVWSLFP